MARHKNFYKRPRHASVSPDGEQLRTRRLHRTFSDQQDSTVTGQSDTAFSSRSNSYTTSTGTVECFISFQDRATFTNIMQFAIMIITAIASVLLAQQLFGHSNNLEGPNSEKHDASHMAEIHREKRHQLQKRGIQAQVGHSIKSSVIGMSENLKRRLATGEDQYVVVFDAGSTGTRLHVYQFCLQDDGDGVKLVHEVFQKMKPGLSDFADNPEQGAANIQPLIDLAVASVPENLRQGTPLVFKATAGFRLLGKEKADNLLNKVRERLATTTFAFNLDDVNIMGGVEEGILGWMTINFLLDIDFGNSSAALDLGGASVQVTLETMQEDNYPTEDLHIVDIFDQNVGLYTHSYLGMGLKAARLGIMNLRKEADGKLMSYCLPVGYSGTFNYAEDIYAIKGPEAADLEKCMNQVGDFVSGFQAVSLKELEKPGWHIYLFSYFFEVLQWAGAIGKDETEKILSLDDIYHLGLKVCRSADPNEPFLCQDLVYITRLLGDAFEIYENPFHVVSQINKGETSWALGAALAAL